MEERTVELADLRTEIAAVFTEVVKKEVPSHDTDFLTTGLLDPLGLVELLLDLGRRFGVHLAMQSLEPDTFRTLDSIAACVGAHRDVA